MAVDNYRNDFVSIIVGVTCQTWFMRGRGRPPRDEKVIASCRAVRAEQAGNGEGHSVAVFDSFLVKHLPKSALGLYNFQTWSKERHLWTRRLGGCP